MPSIQESVQKHQELLSEGKGTPVRSVPENSPILPEPANIGQLGPSRGSFVPGQVLDTDIAKQNIIGTPERSRMFPIPSNNGNNNAGIQQALKSIVKASEASVAQTVASFKNTPVATTDPSTGLLTQTTIGQSTPLPSAPPERRIPLDNVDNGVVYNKFLAANMFNGGILPAHVTGQLASLDLGTITDLTSFISLPPGTGWQLASSLSIDLPNGLNSITFQVHSANIANSGSGTVQVGTASGEGWGLAIYSGAAPSSPSANSNGAITTGSTVTVSNPLGGNVTLGIYIFFTSGTFSGTSGTAKLAIRTVIPVSIAAIT